MELFIFLGLLFLGLVVGKIAEKRHYASIRGREAEQLQRPAMTFDPEGGFEDAVSSGLATGSVVVSVDYFKIFLSGFRMFFGGEMKSYSSLIDRARREALLRMKESCPEADLFLNTRLETSSITQGQKNSVGSIEVVAYSTAVELQK